MRAEVIPGIIRPFINHETYHVFFTKLANPLKMGIILALREKEMNVSEIVGELGVEQSKISHALASLKNCNILQVKNKGKERIYFLNKDTILPLLDLVDKHSEKYCKICLARKNKIMERYGK